MPPEHDDREGHEHEGVADARVDVEGRHQEAGRDSEAGAAETEGDGIDVLHVDADEARAELLLRDRANRLAGVGAGQEQATGGR